MAADCKAVRIAITRPEACSEAYHGPDCLWDVSRSGQRWSASIPRRKVHRSEEHTSELQSLMRHSYAVFCLKKKNKNITISISKSHHNSNKHITIFLSTYYTL